MSRRSGRTGKSRHPSHRCDRASRRTLIALWRTTTVWRSLKGSGYLGCCQRERFAPSFLRLWIIWVKVRFFGSSAAVDEIIHPWKSVVFHRQFAYALDFLSEVHPSRAALQPCLDGPARTSGSSRFRTLRYPAPSDRLLVFSLFRARQRCALRFTGCLPRLRG